MRPNLLVLPPSPALIPELAPADTAAARLRGVFSVALTDLTIDPDRPIELVGSRSDRWHTGHVGSFAAWGAPQVRVGAGHHLPELVQRYLLGAELSGRVVDTRDTLGEINPQALTLVAVDGSAGMTPRAPLALIENSRAVDEWCRAVLSGHDTGDWTPAELAGAGVVDADLWVELATVEKRCSELLAADTTTGVARYVAAWEI